MLVVLKIFDYSYKLSIESWILFDKGTIWNISSCMSFLVGINTPYPSVLDFWKIKFENQVRQTGFLTCKSISKWIFAGYTGGKNSVQNRPKIQFVGLDFSKIKYRCIGRKSNQFEIIGNWTRGLQNNAVFVYLFVDNSSFECIKKWWFSGYSFSFMQLWWNWRTIFSRNTTLSSKYQSQMSLR